MLDHPGMYFFVFGVVEGFYICGLQGWFWSLWEAILDLPGMHLFVFGIVEGFHFDLDEMTTKQPIDASTLGLYRLLIRPKGVVRKTCSVFFDQAFLAGLLSAPRTASILV